MSEIVSLIENYWICREQDRELYNKVKRDIPGFQKFAREQLGWKLLNHERFLKLEKIPAHAESFMGIREFQEVRDYVIRSVSDLLERADITYVKWDMNRHITDLGSFCLAEGRQRELSHRYMLGLYEILETLNSRFPHVLFESCSSGGAVSYTHLTLPTNCT